MHLKPTLLFLLGLLLASIQASTVPSPLSFLDANETSFQTEGTTDLVPKFSELINQIVSHLSRIPQQLLGVFITSPAEKIIQFTLPQSKIVYHFDKNASVYEQGVFYAKLSAAANCRGSYEKWDCGEYCNSTLSDGVVVRAFATTPLGVTGVVVKSPSKKKIFIMLRSDSSIRNRILALDDDLMPHPLIPNAKVQRGLLLSMLDIRDIVYRAVKDQLTLHPNYTVDTVGHSYGAGIASLLVADLSQRLPQLNNTNLVGNFLGKPRVGNQEYVKFFADRNITVNRWVEGADEAIHLPRLIDGYAHEGNEYWLKPNSTEVVLCSGPLESSSCSNSINERTAVDHLNYFNVSQVCLNSILNFY